MRQHRAAGAHTGSVRRLSLGLCGLLWVATGCNGDQPAAERPSAPARGEAATKTARGAEAEGAPAEGEPAKSDSPQVDINDPSVPLSRRILGRWHMSIADVPDLALTRELLKLKKSGQGDKVQADYTITETEVIVERSGMGPRVQQRWHYEITRETGDRIELTRTDARGNSIDTVMRIEDGMLWVGTEGGKVPLKRVE